MAFEVHAGCFDEGVEAHVGDQLFEGGGPFSVGDAVKVLACRLKVRDVGYDRVGGGQLVLLVRPCFALVGEGDPGVFEPVGFDSAESAHEIGEGFFEPEIVPPFHGD